ncbi:MAG TPA: CehA/McbA family metallohydrolase, partial [bacterium]|nr:CehA/McbA family metallohydrolase [bacterium]
RRSSAVAAALLLSACHRSASSPSGFVAARQISNSADLIGGPRGEGRVGDFLLTNDHVRIIVSAAQNAVGFDVFGGALLDADIVRPAGEPGGDRFGEAFPSVNVLTLAETDTVEVVADGSDRHRAAIHVHGKGFQFPLVAPIPGLTNAIDCDLDTTYSLGPLDRSVLVQTTVTSNESNADTVQDFDVLLFGAGLDLFGAPLGAGQTGTFDWYGADGPAVPGGSSGVAYAWVPLSEKTLDIPFADASQQVAVMGAANLAPHGRQTYTRRLVIAKDLGDAMAEVERVRGITTGTFSGLVKDSTGSPVEGAFITVTAPGVDANGDGQDDLVARARTDAAGGFSIALPPGHYSAVTSAGLRGTSAPLVFPVSAGKVSQALLVLPALGTISFAATDAFDGSPIPAKLSLVQNGSIVARALAGVTTAGVIAVPPGTYDAYLSRGPEWTISLSPISVTEGGHATIAAADSALSRVVDTTGWISGDFHLHSVQSRDSGVPLPERVLSLAAEGLEYVSSTDHDRATDYSPSIAAQALSPFLAAIVGSEVSIPIYGHFNAYPMPPDAVTTRAYDGTRMWFDAVTLHRLDAAEVIAELRALPGDRIVQMNHPRSVQGYLDAIGYSPLHGTSTEPLATTFDTMEVNEKIDSQSGVLRDWFSMLDQGYLFTAVGVSDSHVTWNPGFPRTMVQVGVDDPALVTTSAFVAAVRAHHAVVSAGPFVTMTGSSSGGLTVGVGDTLAANGGGAVALHVHVESPAWAPFDTLTVYENGKAISTQALTPPLVGGLFLSDVDLAVAPAIDSYYVAVVTGGGSMFPVTGSAIYGYTNPIFVDVGLTGWDPPGL